MWMGKSASVAVPPKPMVVGGRVFGEEGWEPTLYRMTSLSISYHGNGNVSLLLYMILIVTEPDPYLREK